MSARHPTAGRRGAIVTFSGVDGAGKTTQIDLLEAALQADGHRPVRLWYRPGYSPALDRLRGAVRALRPGALPPPGPSARREATFARPGVRRTWAAVALLDALVHYAVRVRALRAAGRVVLCDRYVWDGLLDLELRFPDLGVRRWPLARALERLAPEPDAAFLLVVPWEECVRRAAARAEPFPDPEPLRRARFEALMQLATRPGLTVIDTTASVEGCHAAIAREVASCLSSRMAG